MKYFIWISLLLFSTHLAAFECNPSGNQGEMNKCADDELNEVYQQLVKRANKTQAIAQRLCILLNRIILRGLDEL